MSNGGFVQVLVLAGIASLAALAVAGLSSSQSSSTTAAAVERVLRVDVLSRSAFERVLAALESPPDPFEQQALSSPAVLNLPRQDVVVSLEGEAGKVDAARSPLATMVRLADHLGLPAVGRGAFIADLEALRSQGDAAQALDLVRQRLSPLVADLDALVTIFGDERIDPTYAPQVVLEAIPDLSPVEIAQILSVPPPERGQFTALSEHFATNSRRFSIAANIAWAPDQISIRRLPIELSTSGRAIVLSGAY